MDVVPNGDLKDFLNGLEDKEEEEVEEVKEKETTVWEDIFTALSSWKQSLVDVESRFETTIDFQRGIENIIYRQELDGLLSVQDARELRYVAGLWTRLLHNIASYNIGCVFVKPEIIALMLELYNLHQLGEKTFILCCEKI